VPISPFRLEGSGWRVCLDAIARRLALRRLGAVVLIV
jgi:hypothetical protein